MKPAIVLAMHGVPPADFPKQDTLELFGLHMRLAHAPEAERAAMARRHADLDRKMRAWPRTEANDPYYTGSQELAATLGDETGLRVYLGFNEFCSPSMDEALDQAAQEVSRVYVVTPMMTRGGAHSEQDIPAAVEQARRRHPEVGFTYVWPFSAEAVARFLAEQIAAFAPQGDE